jgi:hypothetical protein
MPVTLSEHMAQASCAPPRYLSRDTVHHQQLTTTTVHISTMLTKEELLPALSTALHDVQQYPSPTVPSPANVPKRASVALILRVSQSYTGSRPRN